MSVVAVDDYGSYQQGLDSPPSHSALVTPSDTDQLAHVSRGFLISVDGAVKVLTAGGETITYPSGTFNVKQQYSARWAQVFATGTTATGIVVWW